MRRTRTGHRSTAKGVRVLVWFADGRRVSDRFEEIKGNRIRFREMGWLPLGIVKHLSPLKGGEP